MDFHGELDSRFALEENASERFTSYLEQCLVRPDHVIFVATQDEKVIGYILGSVMENLEVFKVQRYGFVGDLSVHPDYRRRHIGSMLWQTIRKWFSENHLEAVQLNVSVFNRQGELFWRECGFEDFLKVMWCDLGKEDNVEQES